VGIVLLLNILKVPERSQGGGVILPYVSAVSAMRGGAYLGQNSARQGCYTAGHHHFTRQPIL